MSEQGFSWRARARSFRYAGAGLRSLIVTQHNAWIHAVVTVAVCALGFALRVDAGEWRWLVIAIVLVWSAEAFNTALESLADAAKPELHPLVQRAKDTAAAAVLIAAIGAALIGLLVLGPPLLAALGWAPGPPGAYTGVLS